MQKRRSFSGRFKAQVVLEVLTGVKSAAQVCREHSIKETVLSRWKQEFIERSPELFERQRLRRAGCGTRASGWTLDVGAGDGNKSLTLAELPTEQRQAMVKTLHEHHAYRVTALCSLLEIPRSRYYYASSKATDAPVRQAIQAVAAEFPTYGSRRIAAQLLRAPYTLQVNRKQVQRFMREMDLLRPLKQRVRQTTNSRYPWLRYPNLVLNRQVTQPDELWMADITYVKLQTEFVYLAVVMDVFTRRICGWQLSRWLDQALTLEALQRALAQHGPPQIHHSDQGVQYAARAYVEQLQAFQIQISMADVGAACRNGYAERIIITIKEEEIDLADYQDFADAYAQMGHFIKQVYRHKRIHSALGYLTPAEFEADWRQQRQPPSLTIV